MTSRMKGQGTAAIASIVVSLLAALISLASSYLAPMVIIAACTAACFVVIRKKGSMGQAEMLISLAIIALTAGSVVAYGAYNGTLNSSFTGAFLAAGDGEVNASLSSVVLEASSRTEVWADTYIELEHDDDALIARLLLDDGSPIHGQLLDIRVDGEAFTSGETDSDGEVVLLFEADNVSHDVSASFAGSFAEYLNPSEALIRTEAATIPAEANATMNETPGGWISYDLVTNVITVVGDDEHCTEEEPCTLEDVYEADQENGWNSIERYRTFFIFHSGLRIGDGLNETWFLSSFEHIKIEKPWEVMPLASLQFGIFSDEQGGYGYGGSMIDVNVSEEDQLEHDSAIRVNAGGSLAMYETKYKVFGTAENNIYLHDDSVFRGWRFDIERITEKQPQAPQNVQQPRVFGAEMAMQSQASQEVQSPASPTKLRLPRNAVLSHVLKRVDIIYECADASFCESLEVKA